MPFMKCEDDYSCTDDKIFEDVLSKLPENIRENVNKSLAITPS